MQKQPANRIKTEITFRRLNSSANIVYSGRKCKPGLQAALKQDKRQNFAYIKNATLKAA